MKTVFKGGRVLCSANGWDKVADVMVDAGRIVAVETSIKAPPDARVLECHGLWVAPGFIDMHVHLREPGFEHKETIASGAHAAACAGFATIVAMPNTQPVIDSAQAVHYVMARGREAGRSRVLTTAAITLGQKGETLTPMVELFEAGAVGFTDDGRPVSNAGLMRRALEYASHVGLPVISHAEELTLSANGHMNEGQCSCSLGFLGIPAAAEEVMIARDLILAELTGGRLHIAHLSTAGGLRLVRDAKKRGIAVTCEVAPHHFALTDEAVRGYETNAKMNPPLRTLVDVHALIEGLEDGTVDAIATDHAPHSTLEKDVPFAEAAFGIIGLETAIPVTLSLVHSEKITPMRMVSLFTDGPARVLGLASGTLTPGAVADVTVLDPNVSWAATSFRSRSQNSPFLGKQMRGRAVMTMVAGALVYE